MGSDRFEIVIITAVDKYSENITTHKNISYNELIPKNNSNLTDEEILQITI
jgi:hypothetical protein